MRGERWRLHIPTWQEGISQAGGPIALAQVSSSVHTRAATYTEGFAGGPGKPLVLGKSPVSTQPAINRKAVALLCKASLACQEDLEMRLSACERLRPLLLAGRGRQQQQPGRGQQDRQQHMIMAAWRGGRRQVQELLACLIDPASREPLQAAPAAAAGPRRRGSSAWRRLEDAVVNHWAPDKRKMLWAWLLEMAAEAEEAEAEAEAERTAAADASRGLWPAGVSMVEDADVISAWGTAATEVRALTIYTGTHLRLTAAAVYRLSRVCGAGCKLVGGRRARGAVLAQVAAGLGHSLVLASPLHTQATHAPL